MNIGVVVIAVGGRRVLDQRMVVGLLLLLLLPLKFLHTNVPSLVPSLPSRR